MHPTIFNGLQIGPDRVYAPGTDLPGLAMSRSFGDTASTRLGVICEPDIRTFQITKNDRFILLASDGV